MEARKHELLNGLKPVDRYALTVSPKPAWGQLSLDLQFKALRYRLWKILKECSTFVLIAEFHVKGTLHFHGTIAIHDWVKWHKSTVKKLSVIGLWQIKKIRQLTGWLNYTNKQQDVVQKVLGHDYAPFTHMDKFTKVIITENKHISPVQRTANITQLLLRD